MLAPFGPFGLVAGKTFVGGAGAGGAAGGALDGTVRGPDDAVRVGGCGFSTTRIGSRSAGSATGVAALDGPAVPRSADTEIRVFGAGVLAFAADAGLVEGG
jgi:hypothetical protein